MALKVIVPAASKRARLRLLIALSLLCGFTPTHAQSAINDPLPSWNNSPTKNAIIAFVKRPIFVAGNVRSGGDIGQLTFQIASNARR